MAKQVSGSEKTLLECIRDLEIEQPPLMRWNAWQQWRSTIGRRPILSRDGYAVPQAQESAVWKSVMNELYGPSWSVDLLSGEVTESVDVDETAEPLTGPSGATPSKDVPMHFGL